MDKLGLFIGGAIAGIVGISAFAIVYENLHAENQTSSFANDANTIIADAEAVTEEKNETKESKDGFSNLKNKMAVCLNLFRHSDFISH